MKHRLLALTRLLILLAIVLTGCQGATPVGTPPTESPGTEPPGQGTSEEQPAIFLTPVEKPSLSISDVQSLVSATGASPAHTIAFVFPDGLIAMKAAGVENPEVVDTLTVVGVVEVGEGAEKITFGSYRVAIDLATDDTVVDGRLLPVQEGDERDLAFERTPLERNPAREESPSFPTISPIISSSAVCFVVGLADPSGQVSQTSQSAQSWYRYCSAASTDTGDLILSVRDNFPTQFGAFADAWEQSIAHLTEQGFPQDVDIDTNLTISEMEGHSNLNACNEKKECAADIIGAPNISFWQDYDQAKDAAQGNNFVVTAGIVRVERELDVPGQDAVLPGDYWVRDWFDQDDNFLGATILGVTTDNVPVNGQTIPAIPAYFLDAGAPRTIVSWISGWRLCNWCRWQSNCP